MSKLAVVPAARTLFAQKTFMALHWYSSATQKMPFATGASVINSTMRFAAANQGLCALRWNAAQQRFSSLHRTAFSVLERNVTQTMKTRVASQGQLAKMHSVVLGHSSPMQQMFSARVPLAT